MMWLLQIMCSGITKHQPPNYKQQNKGCIESSILISWWGQQPSIFKQSLEYIMAMVSSHFTHLVVSIYWHIGARELELPFYQSLFCNHTSALSHQCILIVLNFLNCVLCSRYLSIRPLVFM